MVGIDRNPDVVVFVDPSTALENVAQNEVGIGVVHRHAEVQRGRCVGDAHLGSLRGGISINRIALKKAAYDRDGGPKRFVEYPVDIWGDLDRVRCGDLTGCTRPQEWVR